jgi:hypothetical protein
MKIAICHVAQSNVMSEASHKSKLETQVLFGEAVTILETKNNWARIQAHWDNYEGWVLHTQFTEVENLPATEFMQEPIPGQMRLANHIIYLPAGASLPNLKNHDLLIGHLPFQLLSNAVKMQTSFTQENILPIVLSYMHVPYVWGGRTHAGIDCSGISAMLYKYFNIPLKHEATWQSQQGQVLDFLQNAKCGDLAFFDDEDGNITHVGILLNESEIIHATESAGGVTIDDIDNAGIVSRLTGKRTHRLRVVKRIVE